MHRLLAVALALPLLLPAGAEAQEPARATLGVMAGPVQNRQVMERSPDSEGHSGFLVGAWARVRTPAPWLTVTAEATVVRRGAEYEEGPGEPAATVDVDYVSVALLPAVRLPLGPVAVSLFAGPGLDVHLRSQAAISLQSAFSEPATQVFAGVVGGGLDVSLGRALLGVELRHHEQITDAFSGGADEVRHRSTEVVFRIGMSPRPGR